VVVLLLQLRHELLLVVQLVSQAADLLLVDLSVRLDLLLHRILETHTLVSGVRYGPLWGQEAGMDHSGGDGSVP